MRIGRELCRLRLHHQATVTRNPRTASCLPAGGAGVILMFLVIAALIGCEKQAGPPAAAPEVEVAPVRQQDVPLYTEFIATLDGYVNAQIQPQVTGYLLKQNYREGTVVHTGAVLFEIDPRPFEAALQ